MAFIVDPETGQYNFSPETAGLSGASAGYTQQLSNIGKSTTPEITSTPLQSTGADVTTPSLLDKTKGVLQNEGLMKGMLGAGQLGLGLMSYLDSSKLMNEQLKGLKQNRQQAAQSFADQQAQRSAVNAGFNSALT